MKKEIKNLLKDRFSQSVNCNVKFEESFFHCYLEKIIDI